MSREEIILYLIKSIALFIFSLVLFILLIKKEKKDEYGLLNIKVDNIDRAKNKNIDIRNMNNCEKNMQIYYKYIEELEKGNVTINPLYYPVTEEEIKLNYSELVKGDTIDYYEFKERYGPYAYNEEVTESIKRNFKR